MKNMMLILALFISGMAHADDLRRPSSRQIVERLKPHEEFEYKGIRVEGGKPAASTSIDLEVNFEFGSARLTTDAELILSNLGKALNDPELKDSMFRVTGHTDAVGGDAANLALSRARAKTVCDYLIQRHGVEARRLAPDGQGRRQLADPANPKSAVNRRVQIVNLGSS